MVMTKTHDNRQNANEMKTPVRFTKMHGAGNDYIYVDTTKQLVPDPEETAIRLSDRHTGVGGDGLVLIGKADPSTGADFSMRIFNADGSEAMMCGNASRCIGKYVYDRGLWPDTTVRLLTRSGVKTLRLHVGDDNRVDSVTVDMLEPSLSCPALYDDGFNGVLSAHGRTFKGTFVSMGNPHFVIFVDDIDSLDVALYGSCLERHAAFPERCNVEFAQLTADNTLRTRVWERGSGITMACGTGACATTVAAASTGIAGRRCDIMMDGGTLNIDWSEADGHVYMTGGAEFVFDGETLI